MESAFYLNCGENLNFLIVMSLVPVQYGACTIIKVILITDNKTTTNTVILKYFGYKLDLTDDVRGK